MKESKILDYEDCTNIHKLVKKKLLYVDPDVAKRADWIEFNSGQSGLKVK